MEKRFAEKARNKVVAAYWLQASRSPSRFRCCRLQLEVEKGDFETVFKVGQRAWLVFFIVAFCQLFGQVAFSVALFLGFGLVDAVAALDFGLVQFEAQKQHCIAHRTDEYHCGNEYDEGLFHWSQK